MKGLGTHPMDPRDLIHEAYRMPGIGAEDCRSIFLDWAMGLEAGTDPALAAAALLADLAPDPAHPMTSLLTQAATAALPRRTGRRPARRA